jgi:hypothetical protein
MRSMLPPNPSDRISRFSESRNHGPVITPDVTEWKQYLGPCFANAHRIWDRLRGTTNEVGNRFEFELGLVENTNRPNAVCGYDDGSHYVLIYHTLPMFLLEFFNRLLWDANVLSDIGDSAAEIGHARNGFLSPPGFAILFGEAKIRHMDEIVSTFAPRCPERAALAFTLYSYAMQFVVEHEMAHAVNGHVHFASAELKASDIDESAFRAFSDGSKIDRTYTYLEGMADKGSYFSVISGPIVRRMHTSFQVLSSGDEALVSEVKLKILSGAFLAVFLMISDVVAKGGDVSAAEVWNDHPSSLSRALAFCAMPITQAELLPAEVGFFLSRGTRLAWQELSKLEQTSSLFRPFGWLGREDMYSRVYEPNILEDPEAQVLVSHLERYRYRIRS